MKIVLPVIFLFSLQYHAWTQTADPMKVTSPAQGSQWIDEVEFRWENWIENRAALGDTAEIYLSNINFAENNGNVLIAWAVPLEAGSYTWNVADGTLEPQYDTVPAWQYRAVLITSTGKQFASGWFFLHPSTPASQKKRTDEDGSGGEPSDEKRNPDDSNPATAQWIPVLELSYGTGFGQVHGVYGPEGLDTADQFFFDKNDNLFICDYGKVLVVDKSIRKVEKEITPAKGDERYFGPGLQFFVDSEDNLIMLEYGGIVVYDQNGKLVNTYIDVKRNIWGELAHQVFVYKNNLVSLTSRDFLDDKKGDLDIGDDGYLLMDIASGKRLDTPKLPGNGYAYGSAGALKRKNLEDSEQLLKVKKYERRDELSAKLMELPAFIDEDGNVYANDLEIHRKAAEIRREIAREDPDLERDEKLKKQIETDPKKIPFAFPEDPDPMGLGFKNIIYFVGADKQNNTYWSDAFYKVMVFDRYGNAIKRISLRELQKSGLRGSNPIQIDSKGNLYYIWADEKEYKILKYERDW